MPVRVIRQLLWIAVVFAFVARSANAQDANRIDQVIKYSLTTTASSAQCFWRRTAPSSSTERTASPT